MRALHRDSKVKLSKGVCLTALRDSIILSCNTKLSKGSTGYIKEYKENTGYIREYKESARELTLRFDVDVLRVYLYWDIGAGARFRLSYKNEVKKVKHESQ